MQKLKCFSSALVLKHEF